jgi:pyruvate/2-oxoglutarate dehydrogenase complex dihydrolipoamide acyltransferase (E2) component
MKIVDEASVKPSGEMMKQQQLDYRVFPNPKIRRWFAAAFRSAQREPMMHGLIEVDVTGPREFLREQKAKTGESLSFTAFIIACLGRAIDENKAVQAFRKGNRHLVVFDDVDVYTLIERDVGGEVPIMPHIVRAANRKTVAEIHNEIRTAQVRDVTSVVSWLRYQPDFLFRPFFWGFSSVGRRYPQIWKKFVGTAGVTAVGMFGKGAGWGIPPPLPTLLITLGGIGQKPAIVAGGTTTRDYLSLTISFDHNIVDGGPAARFTERLKELIESGYGLPISTVESVHETARRAPE